MPESAHDEVLRLVRLGELNDAFALAAKRYQFHAENEAFIELLENALAELGFSDASDEMHRFRMSLQKHKALQSENISQHRSQGANRWAFDGSREFLTNPVWELRAKYVARLIGKDAVVLDIGCGDMLIERYLGSGCRYIPSDIARRDERTILCDLDNGNFPDVDGITHVVCLGVVNHLRNQRTVLDRLCRYGVTLLLTFKPFDLMKQKAEQGVVFQPLPHKDVIEVLKAHYESTRFKKILGSGSEILYVGQHYRER